MLVAYHVLKAYVAYHVLFLFFYFIFLCCCAISFFFFFCSGWRCWGAVLGFWPRWFNRAFLRTLKLLPNFCLSSRRAAKMKRYIFFYFYFIFIFIFFLFFLLLFYFFIIIFFFTFHCRVM